MLCYHPPHGLLHPLLQLVGRLLLPGHDGVPHMSGQLDRQSTVDRRLGLGGGPLGLLGWMIDPVGVVLNGPMIPESEAGEELVLDGRVESPEDDGLVAQSSDSLYVLTSI